MVSLALPAEAKLLCFRDAPYGNFVKNFYLLSPSFGWWRVSCLSSSPLLHGRVGRGARAQIVLVQEQREPDVSARAYLKKDGDRNIQFLANGFMAGLTIALMALAFTTIYLPTRVFFVALGGIYTLVPFIAWSCLHAGIPWIGVIVICIGTGTALAIGCEAINHGPLQKRNASPTVHLVSSLGLYIIFVQSVALIWGNESKVLRNGLDAVFNVGEVVLTGAQLIAASSACALILAFFLWLKLTDLGLRFCALADNPVELALRGHDTSRLRIVAFGIGGAFTSAATMMVAFDIGFDPHGGLNALLISVIAMIIGGTRSFLGPVIAGVALGLLRSGVVWYWSASMQDAVTFAIVATFLVFRPQGLFADRDRPDASA